MSVPEPSFTIVIPTYNRAAVVERTVRQLGAQRYPADRYEVIVVDNSTDGAPDVVERTGHELACAVRVLRVTEKLPAVKRNQGLLAATGDLVVFLNDDVWVDPDFLAEHAGTHAADPDEPIAVLGFIAQAPEMPPDPFTDWFVPFDYRDAARQAAALPWFFFWTMNISLPRRTLLDRNLLFHEDWAEIGEEDVELGYRWTRAGYRIVYNARARGTHYHPHSLASASRVQESIGRGLKDLTALVDDPGVLERWGVFSWTNSRRAIVRGLARRVLFNAATVPLVERWLNGLARNNRLSRWMYWKVLLHYTNRGFRQAPQRDLRPRPTMSIPPA
jgi:glycosyltransferase involved in cell wall biosynthesis